MTQQPDNKPGNYYVTVRRQGGAIAERTLFAAGPFHYHRDALAMVQRVIDYAYRIGDPHAPWYEYGTARVPLDITQPNWQTPYGAINKHLGLPHEEIRYYLPKYQR